MSGIDVVNKNRKLERRPVDSSGNGANEDLNQPSTSKDNKEEMATDEDSYTTAEDISIDLENTIKEETEINAPMKSFRNCIEYEKSSYYYRYTAQEAFDGERPTQIDENYLAPDEVPDAAFSQSILNPERRQSHDDKVNEIQLECNEDNSIDKENTKETASGVIHLDSSTDSESRPLARCSLNIKKDKKLANVLGFRNGGVPKSRKFNGRQRTTSHRNRHSDSSERTSEIDVSSPHGRRNRNAFITSYQYIKPRSAKRLSLEEKGDSFVKLGKKVYPLVNNDKTAKNYVISLPESDSEEDVNYWKLQYIKERKLTADLKKNENRQRFPSRQDGYQGNEIIQRYSGAEKPQQNKDTIKIKFAKNDKEIQLEGHWQYIKPALAGVVSLVYKESTEKKPETITCVELSSGNTTPVITPTVPTDIGVRDKVNELETAIFIEIEEKDKNNGDVQGAAEQQEKNDEQIVTIQDVDESEVTQRKKRDRPTKVSSPALVEAIAQSPAKRRKKSVEQSKPSDKESKTLEVKETPNVPRQTRSSRKLFDVVTPKAKTTRKSAAKRPATVSFARTRRGHQQHI